jgi:hypothetical protein
MALVSYKAATIDRQEPGDPTILNNLKLLDESQRFLARSPDAP